MRVVGEKILYRWPGGWGSKAQQARQQTSTARRMVESETKESVDLPATHLGVEPQLTKAREFGRAAARSEVHRMPRVVSPDPSRTYPMVGLQHFNGLVGRSRLDAFPQHPL